MPKLLLVLIFLCSISANTFAVEADTAEARGFLSYGELARDKIGLTQEEKDWLSKHPTIKLAYDGHFPPYSFLNDNNKLEGFSIDIFNIVSERLGITFENHPDTKWKKLYAAAKKSEVDVVATMVNRPERAQWFNFTNPYVFKSLVIITRNEDQRINKRNDITGKHVALVRDYQYVARILEEYPSITPYYVDTMLDGLNAVSTGKADAAISFLGGAHYLRTKYLLTNLKFAAVYDKGRSLESIAIRKDWPEFTSILNKTLNSIPESQLHELRAKWLPIDFLESITDVKLTAQEKAWIEQHPKILLGTDPEFAPFEYMDEGIYSGMTSDYIKILNQRLGLNMQVVKGLTWDEAVEKAQNNELDVLPAVGLTEERQQFLNYTKPYMKFHRVIITRIDNPFIIDLDSIRNSKVGVQKNSSHEGYLQEHSNLDTIGYDTLQETLLALSSGKVNAIVGNVASATYWIRKLNLTNLKVAAPVSQELQNLHFAVRKDWPELITILQKGLDSISDRQRRLISEKWLLLQYDPVINYGLVWKIAAAFSLLVITILLWNILLNRKVNQRTSQLVHHAHYDQLTNLPNRFLVHDRMTQMINDAKRQNKMVAVLSFDLDEFKRINDTLSHSIGDDLLKETAERLQKSLRVGDTLGRLGGDEFIVLLNHFEEASVVASVVESLLSNFRRSFKIDGRELVITASVGVAIFPGDGDSPETLIKNAGSALHHSKALGRDTYAFYTEEQNKQIARRLQIEGHMRNALERNEFTVVYQPKIDINTEEVVSFEALLRWHSPELGEVSPTEFIAIAESNSLIEPIGLFALQQALKSLAQWQQKFNKPYSMAVNLSPRQFLSNNLLSEVESAINNSGVMNKTLELEITEGVLLNAHKNVEETFDGFYKLGVMLAMDDFGTGYSSMSYLRKYTFNTLKIDREFIHDLTDDIADRQLVQAAIAMAHGLKMKVVAEGVETEEQRSILISQGCDYLQGYLYSKPVPAEKITEILSSENQSFR